MTSKSADQEAILAAMKSPDGRIEFPLAARIGMKLINFYISNGASEQQILGMMAATATKMSPALARIFLNESCRLGVISETGKDACFKLLTDHLGAAPGPIH
ncbi:hypothetical protein [Marinobacterium aestuariivivens]|uniref:Transcriptional regulator n=1 Tax=Marinobacterium aestuariivivens TaxID=1698799 RepID=A0ABW2A4R0_9GAMM